MIRFWKRINLKQCIPMGLWQCHKMQGNSNQAFQNSSQRDGERHGCDEVELWRVGEQPKQVMADCHQDDMQIGIRTRVCCDDILAALKLGTALLL